MTGKEFRNLLNAYLEVVEYANTKNDVIDEEYLDEGEGSYGKTPKAREAMGKLAISRREKPASEYSQKGEKTKKVKAIEKHTRRIDNGPDHGHSGKRSTKPRWSSRGKMDQDARDEGRANSAEYGSGTHGRGEKTKNPKKLRKQKAIGEIDEQLDIYDIVLSHLLDEGYAESFEAAEAIMVNMSEEWLEDIMEGMTMKDFKANRRKLKRREASDDAKKRGHVGKEWYNSGRTYSADEAKHGRSKLDDAERQTRHRSAVDPDDENDDNYSADKTKDPKKLRKQKAMGEH